MRHYTGKHGVLEAFLRDLIANGLTLPENPKHVKRRAAKASQRAARQAKRQQQAALKQQQKLLQKAEAADAAGKSEEAERLREEAERQGEAAAAASVAAANPAAVANNNNNELSQNSNDQLGDAIQPQHATRRLKRSSRNSTGSVSSPDSLLSDQEENGGDKQQQLALVVKRSRPDGESEYALVDLKYLTAPQAAAATPAAAAAPSPQSVSIAGNGFVDPSHFSELADAGLEASVVKAGEEEQVILQQPNREQLIQQQLAMQRPVPVMSSASPAQQSLNATAGQQMHDLQPMQINLPQQPLPQHQLPETGDGHPPQDQQQQQQQVQYDVADDPSQQQQAAQQMMSTIYLTPNGEAIQLQPAATILNGDQQQIHFVQSTMPDGNR